MTSRPIATARGALSAPTGRPAAAAYGALSALSLINLLNYADRYLLAGALPLVQREFGGTDAQMGVLSASFLVVFSAVSPLTGLLGDRVARTWLVGGGALLWSAATAWGGCAESYTELLIARALVGVGEAGYGAAAPSLLADLFPPAWRGRALAIFFAAVPLGAGLGYGAGGALGSAFGWRAAFLLAAAPGCLLGALALLLREPRRGAFDRPDAPRERLDAAGAGLAACAPAGASVTPRAVGRALLARPSYLLNVIGATAMSFATGGLGAWMPTFLFRERGVPLATAGLAFGALLIGAGALATLAGGWAGDRLQRRDRGASFSLTGLSLALAAPFALVAVIATRPPLYWAAIGVALFLLFFNTGPLNAALLNVAPPTMRASAVALHTFATHAFGDALAPALLGALGDVISLPYALAFNAGAVALAGAIFWLGRAALRADLGPVAPPPAPPQTGR
ncbi:MAG: MFS transporter [Polyangiaceae bacterium]|jgi:MFS family permease|nr:MFS transporter [Polyangiaceae bacterium]